MPGPDPPCGTAQKASKLSPFGVRTVSYRVDTPTGRTVARTRTCRPEGPAGHTIRPESIGPADVSSAVGLGRHPQVRLQGLPALGEAALGVVVAERRDDDDIVTVGPVDRGGHRVVGGQLQRVEHAQDLVDVATGRGRA